MEIVIEAFQPFNGDIVIRGEKCFIVIVETEQLYVLVSCSPVLFNGVISLLLQRFIDLIGVFCFCTEAVKIEPIRSLFVDAELGVDSGNRFIKRIKINSLEICLIGKLLEIVKQITCRRKAFHRSEAI